MTAKILLLIEADTNDADYVTGESVVNDNDLEVIRKVCKVLNETNRGHNWVSSEYGKDEDSPYEVYKDLLTEEEIDIFNDYVPYGEYGIHTIVRVKLRKIEILEDLF